MIPEELARLKIERAIAISSDYDSLDEKKLKQVLLCLHNALEILPKNGYEKEQIHSMVNMLLNMDIKKFGYVFKAGSWKSSVLINKEDIIELVWRAHSLLY